MPQVDLSSVSLEQLLDEAERRIQCAKPGFRGVVLMGPPGAGKGTQSPKLKDRICGCHLATGDMLRAAVAAKTALGMKAKAIMERGDLVPDEVVNGIVSDSLKAPECSKGFILDGFPRTIGQAKALDKILQEQNKKIDDVILLEVPDNILVHRITGRRIHKQSGRSYHVEFNPPKVDGIDDVTGEPLIQRKDDNEETLRPRLKNYHAQTSPLANYYGSQGLLRRIDANSTLSNVWQRIKASMSLN